MTDSDPAFTATIAANYERWMVPNFFRPYARHCASLVQEWRPRAILEVGAGTGALTRELATMLPGAAIVATDLNPGMVQVGRASTASRPDIEWAVADVASLPAEGGTVDAVVAQFVVMFFPDRTAALAEIYRVLAPGGRLLMTTWGPIEANPVDLVTEAALAALYPQNPPSFMRQVPHGYHRSERIREDLAAAGFRSHSVEPLEFTVPVGDARELAVALCTGTPNRTEIEARDPGGVPRAVEHVTAALRQHFGSGRVVNQLSALVITAER